MSHLPDKAERPAPLFTIGYEAKTLADFLAELTTAGVRLVIDVRAVAASRRPGFSKTALSGALRDAAIDYLHLRALGTPKEGREMARKGRTQAMRALYAEHLDTPAAELAMQQALAAARETPSALLCYERLASTCHRAVIAKRFAASGTVTVVDL